jgi:hypothetical protein
MRKNRILSTLVLTSFLMAVSSIPATAGFLDKLNKVTKELNTFSQQLEKNTSSSSPADNQQSAAATATSASKSSQKNMIASAKKDQSNSQSSENIVPVNVKIDKQILGTPPNGATMTISPANQHVAWQAFAGSRSVMVVDGVSGPPYDTLLPSSGQAVVFSDDGNHYAYLGRNGDKVDMVVDGKVVGHTPYNNMANYSTLTFGPHGHHVFFIDAFDYTGQGGYRAVMDGQPGPTGIEGGGQPGAIAFSPDGKHYAYAVKNRSKGSFIVYDGKQESFGGSFSFAADGRIINIQPGANGATLLIGGRTILKAYRIFHVETSARGGHVIAQIQPKSMGEPELWADGKIVANPCGQLKSVAFSNDGKRYIAVCAAATNDRNFAVIDGHKGREYMAIEEAPVGDSPKFTADSTHVIYEALVRRGNGALLRFVVIDDKEFGPYGHLRQFGTSGDQQGPSITTSKTGSGYAFVADVFGTAPSTEVLVWNGREIPLRGENVDMGLAPTLSDSGDHLVFESGPLFRDGQLIPDIKAVAYVDRLRQLRHLRFALSPDGTHLVYGNNARRNEFFLDKHPLYNARGHYHMQKAAFTPDSRHLFWVLNLGWKPPEVLYLDEKPVLTLPPQGPFDDVKASNAWQMNPDGSLQFSLKCLAAM